MSVLMNFINFSTITIVVLEITSDTSCRNSSTDPVFISISCTISCDQPIIRLNGDYPFNLIDHDVLPNKTCTNSLGTTTCNHLPCPDPPDPAINITAQIQGFIPAEKITSCMYTVSCRSSECNQITEKNLLLKECDVVPVPKCTVPKCTVPSITSVKPIINMTTVTMVTTVTQSFFEVLPCSSELLTSNDIEPTCDCTSFNDIISTSTLSPIPTSISCNMSSQPPHATTSTITTVITSTTYSMCSSSVPALIPARTFPTITLPQSGKSRS